MGYNHRGDEGMKKGKYLICVILAALCALFAFAACRDGGSETQKTEYTVTLVYNDGATPNAVHSIEKGNGYTLPAAGARTGYEFGGWKTGETLYAAGSSYTVNADTTFTAQWTALSYSIVFDLAEGMGNYSLPDTTAGETVALPETEPARSGYAFDGWVVTYKDANNVLHTAEVSEKAFTMPACNVTITAQWAKLYAVNYALAGGEGNFSQPDMKAGAAVTIPSDKPTRNGYLFERWIVTYTDADAEPQTVAVSLYGTFTMPAGNVTITAQWTKLYRIAFDLAGGDGNFSLSDTKEGVKVDFPAETPVREGYAFDGWSVTYKDSDGTTRTAETSAYAFMMPAGDVTVTARWLKYYSVSYDPAGGTGSYGQGSFKESETVDLPASDPTRSGYDFDGWVVSYEDASGIKHTVEATGGSFRMPSGNVTVTAQWREITYTVYFTAKDFTLAVNYSEGEKLNEGQNYRVPEADGLLPFAYWYYQTYDSTEKVAEDTVVSLLLTDSEDRSIELTAKFALTVGKEDLSSVVPEEYKPEKTAGDIRQGQIVLISGIMHSQAKENWQTVLAYLYGGETPHGFFRFDWWVSDGTTEETGKDPAGWRPENITAAEGWKIQLNGYFDWNPATGDYANYRNTIANCNFSVRIDWTNPNEIEIRMAAAGPDNGGHEIMYYVITPAGDAFTHDVYHIGLSADASYAEFDEITMHTHDYSVNDTCPEDGQLNPYHGDPAKGGKDHNYVDDLCTMCSKVSPEHSAHRYAEHVCTVCKKVDKASLDGIATQKAESYDTYIPEVDEWFKHPAPTIAVSGDFTVKFTYNQGTLAGPTTVIELFDNAEKNLTGQNEPNYFDANPNDQNVWGSISDIGYFTIKKHATGLQGNIVANAGISVSIYVWRIGRNLYAYYEAVGAQSEVLYSWLVTEEIPEYYDNIFDDLNVRLTGYCMGATDWKAYTNAAET